MTKKIKVITPKAIARLARDEVSKVEDTGTAMLQTAQEFLLAVEDILMKHYDFDEKKMKEFEERVRVMLATLGEFERKGFSILNPRDMASVGDIAVERQNRLRAGRAGIQLPTPHEIKSIDSLAPVIKKGKKN